MDTSHDTKKMPKSKVWFSRIKRKFLSNIWFARIVTLVFSLSILGLLVIGLGKLLAPTPIAKYLSYANDFVFAPTSSLPSVSGKVNIAILGKGGVGHEAPDLTDTIMFASVDVQNPKVVLVSLPRDIWIAELRAKLNSAYYWGNERSSLLDKKQEGGGLPLAKSTIEQIVGQPVQYAVIIDFSGFEKIIDTLGGVDVYVDNAFTDTLYPIAGQEAQLCGQVQGLRDEDYRCRYETVEFQTGWQKMDGARALKFVRSRHAEGDEGTDIARSNRQQKVISAIKEKILSKDIYLNSKIALAVAEEIRNSIETDIPDGKLMVLARIFFEARNNLIFQGLPEDLLINPQPGPKQDYQYVFLPKDGNWQKVQEWIKGLIK